MRSFSEQKINKYLEGQTLHRHRHDLVMVHLDAPPHYTGACHPQEMMRLCKCVGIGDDPAPGYAGLDAGAPPSAGRAQQDLSAGMPGAVEALGAVPAAAAPYPQYGQDAAIAKADAERARREAAAVAATGGLPQRARRAGSSGFRNPGGAAARRSSRGWLLLGAKRLKRRGRQTARDPHPHRRARTHAPLHRLLER